MTRKLCAGDRAVYRKPKVSTRPGPRAADIQARPHGEDYAYVVDKYWIVTRVLEDDTVEVRTRRGKVHRVNRDDPSLRKAGWFDRLRGREHYRETREAAIKDGVLPPEAEDR